MDGLLQQAIDRQLRVGQDRAVLALHLSHLLPPAPQPHHRRIARLLLDDAAQLHGGQVFPRPNGDLVLICGGGAEAAAVAATLARLFRNDLAANNKLTTLWIMPRDAEACLAFTERLAPPPNRPPLGQQPRSHSASEAEAVDKIGTLITGTRFSDLVRRQTAMHITSAGPRPLFHEVAFSADALQARAPEMAQAQADPYLFRHLAARMDLRMLDAVSRELTRGGPIAGIRTLHLNLTFSGIATEAFLRFAQIAHDNDVDVGIEVPLMEACANPAAMAAAQETLRETGCAAVLDGVTADALLMTEPAALQPALVKLEWTPRLDTLGPGEQRQLAAALVRIDPSRIILNGAKSEAALAWGMRHGIHRFQGRYVDAMAAVSRMTACVHAAGCTFRQCIVRGAATGEAGRTGCLDMGLLDRGAPDRIENNPAAPALS